MEETIKDFIKFSHYYKENITCGEYIKKNKTGNSINKMINVCEQIISLSESIVNLTLKQNERDEYEMKICENKKLIKILKVLPNNFRVLINEILVKYPKDEPIQNFI